VEHSITLQDHRQLKIGGTRQIEIMGKMG